MVCAASVHARRSKRIGRTASKNCFASVGADRHSIGDHGSWSKTLPSLPLNIDSSRTISTCTARLTAAGRRRPVCDLLLSITASLERLRNQLPPVLKPPQAPDDDDQIVRIERIVVDPIRRKGDDAPALVSQSDPESAPDREAIAARDAERERKIAAQKERERKDAEATATMFHMMGKTSPLL